MYDELYRLLILNKELVLPGIGSFTLNRKPAEANFVEKLVYPPSYSISFLHETPLPEKSFFQKLSEMMNITDREAVIRFNDFTFDLRKKIIAGNEISWKGIGTFSADNRGNINVVPSEIAVIDEPVTAEKVLREHAEHRILVGGQERSSVEMTALLAHQGSKKSFWWIAALVTGVVLGTMIFLHFSKNAWNFSSASNRQLIVPLQAEPTYFTFQ